MRTLLLFFLMTKMLNGATTQGLALYFSSINNRAPLVDTTIYNVNTYDFLNGLNFKVKPLDSIFNIKWREDCGERWHKKGNPLVYKNMVFPYLADKFFFDAETGNRIIYSHSVKNFMEDSVICIFPNISEFELINLNTGKPFFNGNANLNISYDAPNIIKDSLIIFLKSRTVLIALNLKTKKVLWNYQYGSGIVNWAYSEGSIYLSLKSSLVVLDVKTGEKKWELPFPNYSYSKMILVNNLLFMDVFKEGLFAIDINSKVINWKIKSSSGTGKIIADENLIYYNTGKKVYSIDSKSGKIYWCTSTIEDQHFELLNFSALKNYILVTAVTDYDDDPNISYALLNKNDGKLCYANWSDGFISQQPQRNKEQIYHSFVFAEQTYNEKYVYAEKDNQWFYCFEIK